MADITLEFIKTGLYTSIQDLGRAGHEASGVPKSGALDSRSARLANKVLGLEKDYPVLEITLAGPEILFHQAVDIALTGAKFPVTLNGKDVKRYQKIKVPANSILKFGYAKRGCRAYMAVAAEWKIEKWLGSVSPLGFGSHKLKENIINQNGQLVHFSTYNESLEAQEVKKRINLNPIKRVRVAPGSEFDMLSKEGVASFFGKAHSITQEASRMGYKLATELKLESNQNEMISSGILPGTIQLSSAGNPIILLADAQTVGGYPRIARIIDQDLDSIAQLKPGDKVWFSLADTVRK
ncbi:biotin-dependent carboxyltransferase family protein [Marivirga atlantica]|jgi:antagonist of KipI|uniref:Biotin-dependent carboxyltransferase family protein n=1 Tax=Marivirga atlantica TaxID=1548457 RepID=A0A937A9R0_9BACT|nr:biotin-dependent carboxyltransferase family protein [Marivirga atlantica]MBL0766432.1 biotin-dependent carboxyltransferase family protein [Marivirga atlantica]